MREVGEVEIETEEERHVVGTEEIFSQVRNQGKAKEKSASAEMKKVSLSVSKGRVSLVLFYITNAL